MPEHSWGSSAEKGVDKEPCARTAWKGAVLGRHLTPFPPCSLLLPLSLADRFSHPRLASEHSPGLIAPLEWARPMGSPPLRCQTFCRRVCTRHGEQAHGSTRQTPGPGVAPYPACSRPGPRGDVPLPPCPLLLQRCQTRPGRGSHDARARGTSLPFPSASVAPSQQTVSLATGP